MLRRRVMRLLGERWGYRAFSKVVGRGRFFGWWGVSQGRRRWGKLSEEGTGSVEG